MFEVNPMRRIAVGLGNFAGRQLDSSEEQSESNGTNRNSVSAMVLFYRLQSI